jgi:hypothetical protein
MERDVTLQGRSHLAQTAAVHQSMPIGVVVRKKPGITRWAKWSWQVVAVLPGAPQAEWRELRREGDAIEYHAATLDLILWAAETEAYLANLSDGVPSIYVVLRAAPDGDAPLDVAVVTASPFEGQDYADNGDDLVEKVPMPPGLIAWVRDFALEHHVEEEFVKRKRDRKRVDLTEDGKGDARIRQTSDVYRAPRKKVVN